jgi:hypothetical protein
MTSLFKMINYSNDQFVVDSLFLFQGPGCLNGQRAPDRLLCAAHEMQPSHVLSGTSSRYFGADNKCLGFGFKFVLIKVGILDVEQNLCDVSWTCVEMILEPLMVIPSQVRPVV